MKVFLPTLDSIDAIQEIRIFEEYSGLRRTPIVLMGASTWTPDEQRRAFELGAEAGMVRSFSDDWYSA